MRGLSAATSEVQRHAEKKTGRYSCTGDTHLAGRRARRASELPSEQYRLVIARTTSESGGSEE